MTMPAGEKVRKTAAANRRIHRKATDGINFVLSGSSDSIRVGHYPIFVPQKDV